jgi:Fe/S biogenesis protein NfuA
LFTFPGVEKGYNLIEIQLYTYYATNYFSLAVTMTEKQANVLEISQAAVDKIAEMIATRAEGPAAVRVVVHMQAGGGQSEFAFVPLEDQKEDDTVLDTGPFKMFFDPMAAENLVGAKVDYDETRYSTGFHIEYVNPLAGYLESRKKDWGDDPIANQVQQVVDQQINPGVAGHGGWVVLLDVQGDTAYIEMGGGCQGCAVSQMTLKQGIEKMITEKVPEIKQVLDHTDHSTGENPYYSGNTEADSETPLGS